MQPGTALLYVFSIMLFLARTSRAVRKFYVVTSVVLLLVTVLVCVVLLPITWIETDCIRS